MNTKKYRVSIYRLDPEFTIVVNENGIEIIDGKDGWEQPFRDGDVLIEEIEKEEEVRVIRNKKVVYFADPLLSQASETIEQECEDFIQYPLEKAGIEFDKIHCTDSPPFGEMNYDILFFDWGGMSLGNSMLNSFCRQIVKEAEDYPNRLYVVVSSFSQYAMKEALEQFGERHNVLLSINDFITHYKTGL